MTGTQVGAEDRLWAAVLSRDATADGSFVYGVLTTGVFCRPSCPSRRARRENVRFFEGPTEAGLSGLRPCKRCEPTGPGPSARRAEVVAAACRCIDETQVPLDLTSLAARVGVSRFHLHRLFREETGITPKAYADARRAERVRGSLRRGEPIGDSIHGAGFASVSRFYTSSNERLGMTPTEFRNGGAGVAVRFAVGRCSFGAILVAVTGRGVCAVEFGHPEALVRQLQDRFHAARLVGDDPEFSRLMAGIVALLESTSDAGSPIPPDVRGTVFRERVRQALRRVPVGSLPRAGTPPEPARP